MKKSTIITSKTDQLPGVLMLAAMLCCTAGLTTARAQSALEIAMTAEAVCEAGYADTWIVGATCDLGSSIDIKENDAIDIQCNIQTKGWSVDFYVEPPGTDPNSTVSQAVQHTVCPGNGYLAVDADDNLVLQCNYWDGLDQVARQLEIALLPVAEPGIKSMRWLSREVDNPNVVCGIAGRPEDGTAVGGSGNIVTE